MNNICLLCPNECKINKNTNFGFCGTDNKIRIAKFYLHPFEEPCISGSKGSGTIFFCGCSLRCVFCQNYDVSRVKTGKEISVQELADIFKQLEDMGAHNINLVTPTHYSNQIIKALDIYKPSIPIVYNTHGYENIEIVKILLDYVDVFLPDLKFFSPEVSLRYANKSNYFDVASKAVSFMIENKPLKFENELIKSGVIVRHLVIPQNTSDSKKILDWFANFKEKAFINVMSQYTPFGEIYNFPELKRKLSKREYDNVIDYAYSLGIDNLFFQDMKSSGKEYIPVWDF